MGARTRRDLGAAGLLGAALLLAGCGNHSGLTRHRPTDAAASAAVSLPTGLAGGPVTAPSPRSRSARPSPTGGRPRSTAPATRATVAAAHGPAGHRAAAPAPSRPRARRSTPPPAPTGPAVGVSPSAGLSDGQPVRVSGVRFGAGEQLDVRECRTDLTTCSLIGAGPVADGAGAFGATYYVSSSVGLRPCGTGGCVIRVRRAGGAMLSAPIRFG